MGIRVDAASTTPPSQQIVEQILDAIARGTLAPGDRLPSVRALAANALVNPNTVGKAYRELEARGVTFGKNGSGVFVTVDAPKTARTARREFTLAAFCDACREALRAGHDAGELTRILERERTRRIE